MIRTSLLISACLLACGKHATAPSETQQTHSSALVASADGARLYVAHPDTDSVSILDAKGRRIIAEISLASAPPAQDPSTDRYDPNVGPRALCLNGHGTRLYVTGQRSGRIYAVDTAANKVVAAAAICAEPVGVLVSADDAHLFVACAQDDAVVALNAATLSVETRVPVPRKPWALAWASDGKTLFATHFLGPGVSALATSPLALTATWPLADTPSTGDASEPHGQARGLYDALVRPGSSELWVAHLMLGTDTPQPALDFQSTVFPALSLFDAQGNPGARLTVSTHPGDGGAFGDVVSGPHALAFTDDGKFAFVADQDSEDVLVVDANTRIETTILRPLPGHLPEGLAVSGNLLYVYERGSEDIAAFSFTESSAGIVIAASGPAFASLATDPMPSELRLGQKLFYSANSDDVPTTSNHWVACASCHLEGRSDAVTWKFAQGPRDTPSNAGGTRDTGFLFRTADRNQVQDYWKTINVEQGGHFSLSAPAQQPLLDALADYVNDAIPTPIPPSTNATLVAAGKAIFERADVGCTACHNGPALTDSGSGNVSLAMEGIVVLHDVGTCVTGGNFPDAAHQDKDGNARAACAFDTPALRGLWDSAPYLHDGRATTLADVIAQTSGTMGDTTGLSDDEQAALLEYLKSL